MSDSLGLYGEPSEILIVMIQVGNGSEKNESTGGSF